MLLGDHLMGVDEWQSGTFSGVKVLIYFLTVCPSEFILCETS